MLVLNTPTKTLGLELITYLHVIAAAVTRNSFFFPHSKSKITYIGHKWRKFDIGFDCSKNRSLETKILLIFFDFECVHIFKISAKFVFWLPWSS